MYMGVKSDPRAHIFGCYCIVQRDIKQCGAILNTYVKLPCPVCGIPSIAGQFCHKVENFVIVISTRNNKLYKLLLKNIFYHP